MLLCGRKYENRVCRRLFKGLEECVERLGGKHVYLVDDVDAVLAHLRRHPHLIHQVLDVLHTVVGGGIKLMNTVGTSLGERTAGLALSARFHIRRWVGAVYHFCEDSCRRGLAHTPRAAEKVGMRKLSTKNRVLERPRDVILPDERSEILRPILPCRDDILLFVLFHCALWRLTYKDTSFS